MLGDSLDHGIAAGAAERFVHLLESVGIKHCKDDDAGVAVRERRVEPGEHRPLVRQPGERVFAGQAPHRRATSLERAGKPSRDIKRRGSGHREREAAEPDDAPQRIHGANERRAIRPAEPADDAAVGIVERLHLAGCIGGQFGVVPQVAQARGARERFEVLAVDALTVPLHDAGGIEGGAEGSVPFGGGTPFVEMIDGNPDRHADGYQRGAGYQRQPHRTLRFGAARGAHQQAQPVPESRPPFPACRCRHHTQRPITNSVQEATAP